MEIAMLLKNRINRKKMKTALSKENNLKLIKQSRDVKLNITKLIQKLRLTNINYTHLSKTQRLFLFNVISSKMLLKYSFYKKKSLKRNKRKKYKKTLKSLFCRKKNKKNLKLKTGVKKIL